MQKDEGTEELQISNKQTQPNRVKGVGSMGGKESYIKKE